MSIQELFFDLCGDMPVIPWQVRLIDKYNLTFGTHVFDPEDSSPSFIEGTRDTFLEDLHMLAALDTYVASEINKLTNALEVGVGAWKYVQAVASFVAHYNRQSIEETFMDTTLTGIDTFESAIQLADLVRKSREVDQHTYVENKDLRDVSELYDLVMCSGMNVPKKGTLSSMGEHFSLDDYLGHMHRVTNPGGVVVLGLADNSTTPMEVARTMRTLFNRIKIHQNEYRTELSDFPNNYVITAKKI